MVYNEEDLNPTKGKIGEYLYANYLDYSSKGKARCKDPDMQKYGVDWRIEGPTHDIDIDVKLSDRLGDFFAVTYRNSNNIRMPFKKGCEATWLGIVTFDWSRFIENENPAGTTEIDLAHKVKGILVQEYQERKYTYTKLLIEKYVISIIDVKVQTVHQLCKGFSEKESGDGNCEGGEVVALREGTDHYAAAHIKWSAIKPHSKNVHYESKQTSHVATVHYALTYKWEFSRSARIAIDEQGKTLEEMGLKSLEWIKEQNANPKSTFWRKFHLDNQEEFGELLVDVIKKKKQTTSAFV
jgi:hypothetical protein